MSTTKTTPKKTAPPAAKAPKRPAAKAPAKTSKKPVVKAPAKAPKKASAKSAVKTPKTPAAKDPAKTPKKPAAKAPAKTPKKAAAKAPTKPAAKAAAGPGARTFTECLAAFTKAVDGPVSEQKIEQAWVATAFSAGDLTSWTGSPPTSCIYRVRDPMTFSASVVKDPAKALDCIGIGNALGTWNARGDGTFACGKGWLLASIDLVQEQADDDYGDEAAGGDYVSVAYALVKLADGWVGALWDGPVKTLAEIVGLEGVKLGTPCSVWYGE